MRDNEPNASLPVQPRVMNNEHSRALKTWQLATAGPHQLMIYPRIIQDLESLLTPAALLAEYGCGVGFLMEAILTHKPTLPYRGFLGLEINREARLEARKLINPDQAGILNCDLTNAHFPDNLFDIAVCSTMLCHFKPSPLRQALYHSIRMLVPGGTMLICVPSIEWPLRMDTDYIILDEMSNEAFVAMKQSNSYQLRQCYYSRSVYEAFMTEAGFHILASEDMKIPDVAGIGERYRSYAEMPLFYFFKVARPRAYEIPRTVPEAEDLPDSHSSGTCGE